MIELSSKDRAILRGSAQRLKPVLYVGKQGVSETVVAEMQKAFAREELIKVGFKADRNEMDALVAKLEKATASCCVGGVGRKRSFFKPHDETIDRL